MKNNFKIILLMLLFLNNKNILSRQKNKSKETPSRTPVKKSTPAQPPKTLPPKQLEISTTNSNDHNTIIAGWRKEIEENFKKEIDPKAKIYIEKNKNHIFHLLFLISLFEHLKKNTLMESNTKKQDLLEIFNKTKKENETSLTTVLSNEKNEKINNLKIYSSEIFNLIKRNLVFLRYDETQKNNWFKKKLNSLLNANDLESFFSDIYHKHLELIKTIVPNDSSLSQEQYKIYSSLLLRNYMIEIINNNKSFSTFLIQTLMDLVPYITSKIDHDTNIETKKIILFFDKLFKEICNFISIKPNIKKLNTSPILTKIKDYIPGKNKVIAAGVAIAIAAGIGFKIKNYKNNKKDLNETLGKWDQAIKSNDLIKKQLNKIEIKETTHGGIEAFNEWNSLEHEYAKPKGFFSKLKDRIFSSNKNNNNFNKKKIDPLLLKKQKEKNFMSGNTTKNDWIEKVNPEFEMQHIKNQNRNLNTEIEEYDKNALESNENFYQTLENKKKSIQKKAHLEYEN